MSESLKDRLSSHSNSFEGLLSLIPARYYYNDETNSQWKKNNKTTSLEDKKAEAAANRRNKFDPDVGSSALDEIKRREKIAAENTSVPSSKETLVDDDKGEGSDEDDDDDDDDDENVVVYDDHGNVISGTVEESVEQLLRAKAQHPTVEAKPSEPKETKEPKKVKKDKPVTNKKKISTKESPAVNNTTVSSNESNSEVRAMETPESAGSANPTFTSAGSVSLGETQENGNASQFSRKSKEGIEELRARLTAKVNELRTKRKAPGSNVDGAPKNREELLAARKLRLEQKKKQSLKQKAGLEEDKDSNGTDEGSADEDDGGSGGFKRSFDNIGKENDEDSNIMFGQIEFGDGARLGKDVHSIEERRKLKKRNAIDQLKVLENRKSKISKLDKSKQDEITDNAKWSRAILQSEGAKIRDDEKLLRKTIKQKQNRKKRAEKEWKTRIYNIKKGIAGREAKRHANISAHKEAKKLRLKGKKRRDHMKNATTNFKAK